MALENNNLRDLLNDEKFRQWVFAPNEELDAFWNNWLESHPAQQSVASEARELLLLVGPDKDLDVESAQQEVWSRIAYSIRVKPVRMINWWRYAAVVVGFLALAAGALIWNTQRTITYATHYGEIKTFTLPDQSIVMLNGNSRIRFRNGWLTHRMREVWLDDGEGFFTIRQTNAGNPFVVHTADMNINVLGTAFNVNTRRAHIRTQVVLTVGAVKLDLNREQPQSIIMRPGDMVTYSAASNELHQRIVNPNEYSSWRNQMLQFSDVPIEEVVGTIADNLGITIEVKDKSILQQTYTGNVPTNDLAIFFKTLEHSFDVRVVKVSDDHYTVEKN
jgi:transmembrane sensor